MQFDYHTRIKPIPAYNEQNCIRISSNGDTSPEALDNIGFGLAEAKKRCDGFFEAIGLAGEYGLGYSFLVDDTGMGIYSGDGRKLGAPAENYAYRLYYTRGRQWRKVPCERGQEHRRHVRRHSLAL